VAQYIKQSTLHDGDSFKQFLEFLGKDKTMSEVYNVVLQMSKKYLKYYFSKFFFYNFSYIRLNVKHLKSSLRVHSSVTQHSSSVILLNINLFTFCVM